MLEIISFCNFNTSYVTVQRVGKPFRTKHNSISIHPMLRFNCLGRWIVQGIRAFQYILCYGSTSWIWNVLKSPKYFNTSYVTVQPCRFCNFSDLLQNFNTSYVTVQRGGIPTLDNPEGISIHPMLRFNKKLAEIRKAATEFQYILCYGSTELNEITLDFDKYFNTSYVTVQRDNILML